MAECKQKGKTVVPNLTNKYPLIEAKPVSVLTPELRTLGT